VFAVLNTDRQTIADDGLIRQQKEGYFETESEEMEITITLTDAKLDFTATSAADDILGAEKHDDDRLSYGEAEAADARNGDIDGDSTTTDDQITNIDGVIIDLSATATDTQSTPVNYATKSRDAADSEVITLGAQAGDLAAGDKLTSIENLIGSDHGDVLIGNGANNQLNGGDGDDIFVLELGDGKRAADIVRDFTDGEDKLALTLSQADKNTLNTVTDVTAKFTKLLELAMLRLEAGDSSNDATKNDVHILYTGGTNDETVMVLDEFLDGGALMDLTIADFEII